MTAPKVETVSVPVRLPEAVGVKVTAMTQDVPLLQELRWSQVAPGRRDLEIAGDGRGAPRSARRSGSLFVIVTVLRRAGLA